MQRKFASFKLILFPDMGWRGLTTRTQAESKAFIVQMSNYSLFFPCFITFIDYKDILFLF